MEPRLKSVKEPIFGTLPSHVAQKKLPKTRCCSFRNIANMICNTLGENVYDFSQITNDPMNTRVNFTYEDAQFVIDRSFVVNQYINGKPKYTLVAKVMTKYLYHVNKEQIEEWFNV